MAELTKEEEKEIIDKMDLEWELRQRIADHLPEFRIREHWKTLSLHLQKNLTEIEKELSQVEAGTRSAEMLRSVDSRIQFHIFNFFTTASALVGSLYLPTKNHLNWASESEFDRVATDFKRKPATSIVMKIRNRLKSGIQLESTLSYEMRTKFHAKGEGFDVKIDLEENMWAKLRKEFNSAEESYWLINCSHLPSPFQFILKELVASVPDTLQKMDGVFDIAFAPQLKTRKSLLSDLQDVEKYFDDRGMVGI